MSVPAPDLRGLNPAPVTPFTPDGEIDFPAIKRLGSWLATFPEGTAHLLDEIAMEERGETIGEDYF